MLCPGLDRCAVLVDRRIQYTAGVKRGKQIIVCGCQPICGTRGKDRDRQKKVFFAGEVCSVQCSLPAVQQVHELGETHRLAVKYCDRSTWVSR